MIVEYTEIFPIQMMRTKKNLDDEYHDRITIMKKIGLIKLEEAKEELE